jgi:hypothetical protein
MARGVGKPFNMEIFAFPAVGQKAKEAPEH